MNTISFALGILVCLFCFSWAETSAGVAVLSGLSVAEALSFGKRLLTGRVTASGGRG
jgi:hypothetical protein